MPERKAMCRLLYTRRQAGGFLLNRRVVAGQLACSRKLTAALSHRFPSATRAPYPSVHRSILVGLASCNLRGGSDRQHGLNCTEPEIAKTPFYGQLSTESLHLQNPQHQNSRKKISISVNMAILHPQSYFTPGKLIQ
ncbi:hypothetical protein PVAP13_4NG014267 [Panicum virgatum]|uniref:Uncharacterized protein n=1 Tax=Panicum virgatum TaxID=38727 RepID=A0A8T0SYC4_PANVG|nr:hypothetical protein PVAP13_4NG014267 [Panicum virgatum]